MESQIQTCLGKILYDWEKSVNVFKIIVNLQMPGGKGDQWIRGLLAQSVEQLKQTSGKVEDARTARQREKDRLARLRGEVDEGGNRSEHGSGESSGQAGNSRAATQCLPARQRERLVRVSGRDLDSSVGRQKEQERLTSKLSEGASQDQRVRERTRLRENERRGELQENKGEIEQYHHTEPISKTAVGTVGAENVVDVENIEVSRHQKRKKLKLSKSVKEARGQVNIEKEDEKEEVVFIAIKEKQAPPVEVIDIEDSSGETEAPQTEKKNKKKKKDKKDKMEKEKPKKRKRKQENEARFYKNPLFDLSNGNVPNVEDQSKDLLKEADPSINTSVASMGTRFESEGESRVESNQEESFVSEVNSNTSSSASHNLTSSVSTNFGEIEDGGLSTQRSISEAGLVGMKKTYSAGGRKKIFTQEEDAVILSALQREGELLDFVSLAKELGRSYASVRGRLRKLEAGDTKKRHMAFALSEDMAIMDMVLPYVGQVLGGRVPNWEWLRLADEMGQRRCQSLRSRWEHHLKPWLLQHQAGTLNLRINNLLLAHLVSSYSSIDAIVWSEVAKMKEFVGHTESSLRSLFYSKLYKNAQNTLGKERYLVTLKEVAEVEQARVEEERIRKGVKERQEEVIKYWTDRKKRALVDTLLQVEKNNLLLARKIDQRKVETVRVDQNQGEPRKEQLIPVKKKQIKGAAEKGQFESLPRLDHKHNKFCARLADTYNHEQPVLAQVG